MNHERSRRLRQRDAHRRGVRAEAVSVFKLLFFRSKDIADLERLVAVAALDTAYVRRWMVEMMGEDDARVEKWDELVKTFSLAKD